MTNLKSHKILLIRLILMLICVGTSSAIHADVVYLSDNTEITGTATKVGDKVNIVTRGGKVVTVNQSNVLYIARGPVDYSAPPKKEEKPASGFVAILPATQPASSPTVTTTPSPDEKTPTPNQPLVSAQTGFPSVEPQKSSLLCPESNIFTLMRKRPGLSGSTRTNLERQISYYRALLHDRKRKLSDSSSDWLGPDDYVRRRKAFETYLDEANNDFSKVKKLTRRTQRQQRQRYLENGRKKLTQAAQVWGDPLIRRFLLGVAAIQGRSLERAEMLLRDCIRQAPEIAVFHQARGMGLMELDRYDDALESFGAMVELEPDSITAVNIFRRAIQAVPGSEIRSPKYKTAEALLGQFKKIRTDTPNPERTTWLFPNRRVTVSSLSLPIPPMDRLTFRQTIAVPVGPKLLLVDQTALTGAEKILMRLTDGRVVPCSIVRRENNFTLITVPGFSFTPVAFEKQADIQPGLLATAWTTNIMQEMGSQPRSFPIRLGEIEEKIAKVSPGTAPGESAGPVFSKEGKLLGMIAGKTDATKDSTSDIMYTSDEFQKLMRHATRYKPRTSRLPDRIRSPQAVIGKTFLVETVASEKFAEPAGK